MCRMVRELSPKSTIVVGGHVAAIPGVERCWMPTISCAAKAFHGCAGTWEKTRRRRSTIPAIVSGLGTRIMGIRLPKRKGATAATIIPSVGCPMGCNFCTTSSFFGGKGNFVNFFETGDELFEVMCQIEAELNVQSFFVMDENFLLHRSRAMRLLERMKEAGKSWELSVFSSANAIRKYTMEELVELGVSWVWMGLESEKSNYSKLQGTQSAAYPGTAGARNPRAGLDDCWTWSTTRPTISGRRSKHADRARDRFSPVHAVHAGAGNSSLQ